MFGRLAQNTGKNQLKYIGRTHDVSNKAGGRLAQVVTWAGSTVYGQFMWPLYCNAISRPRCESLYDASLLFGGHVQYLIVASFWQLSFSIMVCCTTKIGFTVQLLYLGVAVSNSH